jgi:hypothetical protein
MKLFKKSAVASTEIEREDSLAMEIENARRTPNYYAIALGKAGINLLKKLKEGDTRKHLPQINPIYAGASLDDFEQIKGIVSEKDWLRAGASSPKIGDSGTGGNLELGIEAIKTSYYRFEEKVLEIKRRFDSYKVPLENCLLIGGVGGIGALGIPTLGKILKDRLDLRIISVIICPGEREGREVLRNLYVGYNVTLNLCKDGTINNILIVENQEAGPHPTTAESYDYVNSLFSKRWWLLLGLKDVSELQPMDLHTQLDEGKGICLLTSATDLSRADKYTLVYWVQRLLSQYSEETLRNVKRGLLIAKGNNDLLTQVSISDAKGAFEKICPNSIVKCGQVRTNQSEADIALMLCGLDRYDKLDKMLNATKKWCDEHNVKYEDFLSKVRDVEV